MENNQCSAWSFVCCVFSPAMSLCKKKAGRAQFGKDTKCCFASLPGGYFEVPAFIMKGNHS